MKKLFVFLLLLLTSAAYSQLMPYRLYTKWGYADMTGKLVIPAKFDQANTYDEKCALVMLKDKYGLIDSTGKLLLPLNDEIEIYRWQERKWYILKTGGKYGLVNPEGKLILPVKYDEVIVGGQGPYAGAATGDTYVKVTKDGKVQEATASDWKNLKKVTIGTVEGEPFNDFVEPFTLNNKKGYLIRGKGAGYDSIPAIYDAFDFFDGDYNVRMAKKDGLWGVIGPKNNIIFPFLYGVMGRSASPKFNLYTGMRYGKYGILKPNGDILIPFEWDRLSFANDDFWCMAYKNGKVGIIIFDASAPIFIAPKYKRVTSAPVKILEHQGKKIRFFYVGTEQGYGFVREDGVEYFKDK
ncbi:WG repeat-containing protein [Chitinophaga sp. SYP-B3965]|uniref:WG repeat-containing protein n=1 Tax=Chitinophaga sp. SYP-B3965 TaxID=2663120 RepID=UPI001564D728|nr:WG repeat-containing protein [Chitinophaga sp. SYP-B3965]